MGLYRQGDIVEFNFNPSVGHEPAGRRPGLIVSNDEFNWSTSMVLVCPVTTAPGTFPLHRRLPDNLDESYGYVVVEQVRAYDLDNRDVETVAHLDPEGQFMRNIVNLVRSFL